MREFRQRIPKHILSVKIPTAIGKFQSISMYKWCNFLQRYSIFIKPSMKREDVLVEMEGDLKAELRSYFELHALNF
jgi:hypothetical protein